MSRTTVSKKAVTKTRSLSVCHGSCCVLAGARDVAAALKAALKENLPGARVKVKKGRCSARCGGGPVVTVEPDGTVYTGVTPGMQQRSLRSTWPAERSSGGSPRRRRSSRARSLPWGSPASSRTRC